MSLGRRPGGRGLAAFLYRDRDGWAGPLSKEVIQ